MRRIGLKLAVLLASLGVYSTLVIGSAQAADLYKGVSCSGKAASSTLCQDQGATGNPLTGENGVILTATKIISVIAGVAAVIVIMISGFRFITAGGDPGEAAKARHGLLYALAGLVVIVLAQSIIGFVLSRIAN
jgi:hypothetical protein